MLPLERKQHMGYTTNFEGCFELDRPLASEHHNYLTKFQETRRMKRNAALADKLSDEVRLAAGLPVGPEGAYFVGGGGFCGQDMDDSIKDYNDPPVGQPGLWCQWVPNEEGNVIEWNGGEKFYYYVEWIKYLIEHFLAPWGYKLNSEVRWVGEDPSDTGKIQIADNVVKVLKGRIVYEESDG